MQLLWQGIILVALVILLVSFVRQLYNIVWRRMAPFIITRPKVIKNIVNNLELADGQNVYELGCGNAPFLWQVASRFPRVKLVGVEYSLWPYLLARSRGLAIGKRWQILKKDFTDINLSQANLIYCYLNLDTMAQLEKKFNKECSAGTKIISYNFPLPVRQANQIVKVGNKSVYFYSL